MVPQIGNTSLKIDIPDELTTSHEIIKATETVAPIDQPFETRQFDVIIAGTTESLTLRKDNYAHFMSTDCELSKRAEKFVHETYALDMKTVRERKSQEGQVIITDRGKYKVFHIFCKKHYFDKAEPIEIIEGLENLRDNMIDLQVNHIRLSQTSDETEILPKTN